MKRWLYPLLIAFVAFLIFSSPTRAGTETRTFVIWIGDLAEAAGDFLDGLFTDDAAAEPSGVLDVTDNDGVVTGTIPADDGVVITPTPEGTTGGPDTGDSSDGFGPPTTSSG